jgi:prepilin-type N-terminal cleavage/methylation domain-containing protein
MNVSSRGRQRNAGYTLIEVVVVMAIIGIIANIAIPIYRHARLKAEAAKIVADFVAVRFAASQYYHDHREWPKEAPSGNEPKELTPYLEGRINWKRGTYRYDWETWVNPKGKPTKIKSGILIGFTVRSNDEALLWMIENVWGREVAKPRGRGSVTFVIQGT